MNSVVSECPSNTFLNGKECVISCPNGKFGVKNIGSNCDVSCSSCENSSTLCTNCFEGNFLIGNQCLNSCPNGTFTFQGYCVSECPSGSYLYENNCQIEIEYYNVNDKIVKQPKNHYFLNLQVFHEVRQVYDFERLSTRNNDFRQID